MDETELSRILARLDEITTRTKVADGRGAYIGDGLPSKFGHLRSDDLAKIVREVIFTRTQKSAV